MDEWRFVSGLDRSYSSDQRSFLLRRHFAIKRSKCRKLDRRAIDGRVATFSLVKTSKQLSDQDPKPPRRSYPSDSGEKSETHRSRGIDGSWIQSSPEQAGLWMSFPSQLRAATRRDQTVVEDKEGHQPFEAEAGLAHQINSDTRTEATAPPTAQIVTILGQARTDPFDSCAYSTTDLDNFYRDYHLGDCTKAFGATRATCFHPVREWCFQLIRVDHTVALVSAAYSAECIASRASDHRAKLDAVRYRQRAIPQINTAIRDQRNEPGDLLLMAVIATVICYLDTGKHRTSLEALAEVKTHIQGIRAMIAVRGGWAAVQDVHPTVRFLIYWTDLICNGDLSLGSTLPSEHAPLRAPQCERSVCLLTPLRPEYYADELVGAYRDFFALAKSQASLSKPRGATRCNSFAHLFHPSRPAFDVLCRKPGVVLTPIITRLYVNILIWRFRNEPASRSAKLCAWFERNMQRCDVDLRSGHEMLYWSLSYNLATPELLDPAAQELMSRLLQACSHIDSAIVDRLSQNLLGFILAHNVPNPNFDDDFWKPDEFERIVHGAPRA